METKRHSSDTEVKSNKHKEAKGEYFGRGKSETSHLINN